MRSVATWVLGSLLVLGVGGCARDEASRLDRWTKEIAAIAPADAPRRLEAMRVQAGLPLSFWAGDAASGNPAVEAIRGEHPCGPVALAFVEKIPAYEPDAALESEQVAEIDAEGRVVRTWSVPVDVIVDGVRGEELLFSESFDRGDAPPLSVRLALLPDGSYRVEQREPRLPAVNAVDCPVLDLWGESAYVRCWRYRDAETGRDRLIAYQGPCT